jgi:hypothetical protein
MAGLWNGPKRLVFSGRGLARQTPFLRRRGGQWVFHAALVAGVNRVPGHGEVKKFWVSSEQLLFSRCCRPFVAFPLGRNLSEAPILG